VRQRIQPSRQHLRMQTAPILLRDRYPYGHSPIMQGCKQCPTCIVRHVQHRTLRVDLALGWGSVVAVGVHHFITKQLTARPT
jgi:hypothetical protein